MATKKHPHVILKLVFMLGVAASNMCWVTGCKNKSATATVSTSSDGEIPPIIYRDDGTAEISFDALAIPIEIDQDYEERMMRDELRKLEGKRIVIRGYILPASVYQDRNIKQFVLIRDNQQCCFGPGAKIYHNMQIDMAEGTTADFTTRPVTLKGEFHIRPWHAPDGKCYSIYHATADSVRQ